MEVLLERATQRSMSHGEVLFQQGDPGSRMFVLLAGEVAIGLENVDGRAQVLNMLKPGDVFGGHCQVNGGRPKLGTTADVRLALCRRLGARLLSPDPKGLRTSTVVGASGHQMSTRPKVTVDHTVYREKPLRLWQRLEALHLSFSASGWLMRILCAIIQIPARPVPDIGHDITMRNTVTTQGIGDQAPRLVP